MRKLEEVESLWLWSTNPPQGEDMDKPSLDDVLIYAKAMVRSIVAKNKKVGSLPAEQKLDMEQDAYVRVINAYPEIQPVGWKSFVYTHCRGAVLDYQKAGHGFEEQRWSIAKPEEKNAVHAGKISERVVLHNSEGADISIDQVMGKYGAFTELDLDKVKIDWELVARMASQDESLRAFAMSLRGVTLEQMGPVFGVKVARAGQLVQAFIDRFDDPEYSDCRWFKQCCFALGISERLGMAHVDQSLVHGYSIGWNLPSVDLDYAPEAYVDQQMSLLDG